MSKENNKIQNKLTAARSLTPEIEMVTSTYTFPIYKFDLSKVLDANDIVQLTYDYQQKNPAGDRYSTVHGWFSGYFSHQNHDDPRKEKLISLIEERTERIINQGMNKNVKARVFNFWYNILKKGGFIEKHDHMSGNLDQYSCVYYAKTTPEMPPIIFEDIYKILPKTNMLLIWPSQLRHSVDTLEIDEDRITISANMCLEGYINVDSASGSK